MEKLNTFTADSVWYIGSTKRTLKQWCEVYGIELEKVQQRMKNGYTIARALTNKDFEERQGAKKKKSIEELKAEYAVVKPIVIDHEFEKNVPMLTFTDAAKERERFAFRIMYGKNQVNELTTY